MNLSNIIDRISLQVLPYIVVCFLVLLYKTCKIQVINPSNIKPFKNLEKAGILSFWHKDIFTVFTFFSAVNKGIAMVSPSRDGEYIARILKIKGITPSRGSTGKGALMSMREMIRYVKKGFSAAIVADGSRGPALKAQPGAVYLAAQTGSPIIPCNVIIDKKIRFNSWDKMEIPLPFSRIRIVFGELIHVPKVITKENIAVYLNKLQQEMDKLLQVS